MKIRQLDTGMLASNCYIIGDAGEGAVIDPGTEVREILEVIAEEQLDLKYIILTHAHIDHIVSMEELRKETRAEVLIHEEDAMLLPDPIYNGAALFGLRKAYEAADRTVKDGEIIRFGGLELEVIHTPGHTPGGISIKTGKLVFTGDTLFRLGVGRTDLGKGDRNKLEHSLKYKLMSLDDDVVVYPGHGPSTTIGYERRSNGW